MPHQGAAHRRSRPAPLDPGVQGFGAREQRRDPTGGRGEHGFRLLDRGFLVAIRLGQPLVQSERVARRGEDRAAVDNAQRAVHTEAEAFEHRGEVPRIDRLAVDRGLAAHRLEPGAYRKAGRNGGRWQPAEGQRRPRQPVQQRRVGGGRRRWNP